MPKFLDDIQLERLAYNLRYYRKQKGLTQKQLSSLTKQYDCKPVSVSSIQKYETKKQSYIKSSDILGLCKALNMSSAELLAENPRDVIQEKQEQKRTKTPSKKSKQQTDNKEQQINITTKLDINNKLVHTSQVIDLLNEMLLKRYPIDSFKKAELFLKEFKYHLGDIKTPTNVQKLLLDLSEQIDSTQDNITQSQIASTTDSMEQLIEQYAISNPFVSSFAIKPDDFSKVFETSDFMTDEDVINSIRRDAKSTAILFMELKKNGLSDTQAISVLRIILNEMNDD